MWLRRLNTWSQLHPLNAESFATGDFDGNGLDDLVVDFGATSGLWLWMNHGDLGRAAHVQSRRHRDRRFRSRTDGTRSS